MLVVVVVVSIKTFDGCLSCDRIKKSGSTLLTKGFVMEPKIGLIWPFLNNGGCNFKVLKGLSKFLEREI